MHIPDGFIDGKTAATTALLSAAGVGLALRQVRRTLAPRRVPLLGLAAAFLFAAQMVNFPVAGGTSVQIFGHNFDGATVVDFGSTPATSVVVVSDAVVDAVSPGGTGVVNVRVTTPSGESAIRAPLDHFTYSG